jgi:hypothetical protein
MNIVAIERDGLDIRSIAITLDIFSDKIKTEDDIRVAVQSACNEYVRTPEGKKNYEYNCSSFNWGDFGYVPNSICEKYGFRQVSSDINDFDVDWDEELVTDCPNNKDEE